MKEYINKSKRFLAMLVASSMMLSGAAQVVEAAPKTNEEVIVEEVEIEEVEIEEVEIDEVEIDEEEEEEVKEEVVVEVENLLKDDNVHTISSSDMSVRVDTNFPRVIDYTMADGKIMHGQPLTLDTIIINDVNTTPQAITVETDGDNKIVYTIELENADENINAVLTAEFEVVDNTLAFRITEIKNRNEDQSVDENIIRTIEIPNHSLVSVRSGGGDAELMGAKMATNTVFSGDTKTVVDDKLTKFAEGYMYAFVSDDNLSAGLASNSQTSKHGDFNRVYAKATAHEGFNSVGLSSSEFIYYRDVAFDENTLDLPEVKVAITGDINGDKIVDWQDGAVAFRDIMYLPKGAEDVKDLVAYRIAMNFGSHAQNPFLMTLDNIKKVNVHTDGLGQSILLKGYGNEGHDSGHLNYKDIGRRMGGVDEFRDLLDQSVDYGASVGIHVNASETYPESPYFEEDRLRKDANGNYSYGWNWIDQGININAEYDLANGRRERFADLADVIGGKDNNLGWVYVDVWGNGQSGDNGSWTSHQLAKELHDQGWRVGGEWGYAFESNSTFQHWATDVNYGGHTLKGINSNVTRFIFNGYRDSWNANYTRNSGSSDNPLLGGYNMQDFEGWQGRNDYDSYMTNLFENNLSTKFVQHFDATRWIEGEPVTMPNPGGGTVRWTPEMEIHLEGDDGLGTLVIERKSNNYADNIEGY